MNTLGRSPESKDTAPEGLIEGCIVRRARRDFRCHGDGAGSQVRQYAAGHHDIAPGDMCIEYVGETPAFQTGPHVCIPCATAFYRSGP